MSNEEIRAAFRQVRSRSLIGVLMASSSAVMFALGGYFISSNPETTAGLIMLAVGGLELLGGIGFALISWRCPACGKSLGTDLKPRQCPSCGVPLE